MKKFIGYIRKFVDEELDWKYLIFLVVFLTVAIYWAYPDGHATTYRAFRMKKAGELGLFRYHFLLYGIPFFTAYLGYIFFRKRYDLLKNWKFWALSVFSISLFAFRSSSSGAADVIAQWFDFETYPNFGNRIVRDVSRMLVVMLPITVYWFFDKKSTQIVNPETGLLYEGNSPYGFTLKNFNLKPYFGMLLIMLPIVVGFGLTDHFGGYYPRGLKNLDYYFGYGVDPPASNLLFYELIYGLDFVSIEYFFRGFLVIAFIRFVGPGAILPMATFYVFIHFGKPMFETISSFFGGSLLGILAFYSRSIWGGIVVHMGIAWLMELGAYLGKVSSQ